MASRFYIHNANAPYTPATIRGAWDSTGSAVVKRLEAAKEGSVTTITSIAVAETNATDEYDVLLLRAISGPLKAATIGTGTFDLVLGALEANTDANFHWHVHIYVTQGDSDTVRGTLLSDYRESAGTNEWPTTAAGHGLNAAQSLSSVAVSDGDRLVIELGYTARNTHTTSRAGTLWYGIGNVNYDDLAVSGDETTLRGWVEFSEDLAFTTDARVTQGALETVILSDEVPEARVTQGVLETILLSDEVAEARITQAVLEIILLPSTVVEKSSIFLGLGSDLWAN
jgi:hypothetical protein